MSYEQPRIDFSDGVRARLAELRQSATYEGLLEGLPTREMNATKMDRIRADHPGIVVLEPAETPIERRSKRPYPFGTPSRMPPVQCLARASTLDGDHIWQAWFAWFQNSWGLPIEQSVRARLRELDWYEVATRSEL